jgi:hypothetical protein
MDRRSLLKMGAGAVGAMLAPAPLMALAGPQEIFVDLVFPDGLWKWPASGGVVEPGEICLVGERASETLILGAQRASGEWLNVGRTVDGSLMYIMPLPPGVEVLSVLCNGEHVDLL